MKITSIGCYSQWSPVYHHHHHHHHHHSESLKSSSRRRRLSGVKYSWGHFTTSLQFHLLFPPWVLLQDNEPLQHVRERNIFFRRKLRPLCRGHSYRCLVRLETGDRAWLPCLTYNVDSLRVGMIFRRILGGSVETYCAHSDSDGFRFKIIVKRDQESGEHSRDKEVKHPMVLIQYNYGRSNVDSLYQTD